MTLTVATSQFPVSGTPRENLSHIRRQITEAADNGADVVHFPESALSGYAGVDLKTFDGYPWQELNELTSQVADVARTAGLWVVLGSTHQLTEPHKPHNSLYIIKNTGEIVERYDKRFCSGNAQETSGDLAHYSPGNHFSFFEINGVKCSALICHDYRYPELYRQLKASGVDLVFHSYHAGHMSDAWLEESNAYVGKRNWGLNGGAENSTLPAITMRASMVAAAAANHVYISCSNSSREFSAWGAFFVRADGVVTGQLQRHQEGLLLTSVDTTEELYDSTETWRERTIAGTLHSGDLVDDALSVDPPSSDNFDG